MVKWISADNPDSSIGNAIAQAAQTMYGDTLTPALKREQLRKAQRENAGAEGLMAAFGNWGKAAAGYQRPGAAPVGGGGAPHQPVFGEPATSGMLGEPSPGLSYGLPAPAAPTTAAPLKYGYVGRDGFKQGVIDAATALGANPLDLATAISYETGGTLDPQQAGPTTQYGQHKGLIQFGQPQAAQYGADFSTPYDAMNSQLGADGAIVHYLQDHGYQPGMGLADLYSTINAGAPGRYGASDAANGGAPGTVADKVAGMGGHAADMAAMFGGDYLPDATASPMTGAPATDPGAYNPLNPGQLFGEIAQRTIEAGIDPQKAADLIRMFTGNTFGAENQATTDAFVGAGGDYGNTYSGFAADQNRQERNSVRNADVTARGQDMTYDLGVYKDQNDMVKVLRDGAPMQVRKGDMLPTDRAIVSDAENKALTAQGIEMTPAQKMAYVGAEPKAPPTADGYFSATDGQVHRSLDGLTDAVTGKPLPADAIKTSVIAADRATAGLDKINDRNAESQILSMNTALDDLSQFRKLGDNPRLFGISGVGLRIGSNVLQQWQQLSAADPDIASAIQSGNADSIGRLRDLAADPNFDPHGIISHFLTTDLVPQMSELEMYAAIMPYTLASAMAGQEGRSVTDKDVTIFKNMLGDPTSLLSTRQGFQAKVDAAAGYIQRHLDRLNAARAGGANAQPDGSTPPPAPPAGNPPVVHSGDDAAYNALPSGADFVDENGQHWKKP